MNWLQATKTRLIYVGRMCRILWTSDRMFLFLVLVDIILLSVFPFVNMRLIKYSVDMLSSGGDFSQYLPMVFGLLALSLTLGVLQTIINTRGNIHGNVIGDTLFRKIFNKTMELDYEMLQDKNIMEKRELALEVINQGRFNNLVGNFRMFVSTLMVVSGIIYIVSSIELWLLLIVIAIVVINSLSATKRKDAVRGIHVESAPIHRKKGYFWSITYDVAYGKEIRSYNMQDSLNSIHDGLAKISRKNTERVLGLYCQSGII
jgi:ATP-binding cassette subfamily B protein/ATP-binding cassette subfamily C protein